MKNNTELPFITVCLPVRNESLFIKDTLAQLLAQSYPKERFEIIVADGQSTDGTTEIVKYFSSLYPQIILKSNKKEQSGPGRNIGFKYGRGDIFLIVDGHCFIPTRNFLINIVKCFNISNADCLGRPQPLNPPGISAFQEMVATVRSSFIAHSGNSYIFSNYEGFVSPVSHGAVYKRYVVDSIGMVDETFDACEDVDFNIRVEKAGFKTFMSPSIKIFYYPRDNLKSLFSQMVRYGKGRFTLALKHPDYLGFNSLVPFFFVTIFLISILLVLFQFKIGIYLFIFYLTYLILIFLYSAKLCIQKRSILFFQTTLIFLTIHFGLGYGFLKGLFKFYFFKFFSKRR